ncbi:MAG: M1 family metallopeptidase [Candidatus Acidiferrales bacterium]
MRLPILAAILAVAPIAAAQRLPELATPEHYQLTIATDFEKEKFSGDETIQIRVLKPTSSITLNAAEITFAEVTIASGGQTQTAKVTPDEKNEMASFAVEKPLPAGPATIHIRYTGILNGQLRGLYLSKANGRKYAISQLENTDARRMYPSFDEPAYKATFDITAIVDKGDTAIANGKIVSDTPGPGETKHTLKFSTTPKMSSYLVALVVGDWQCSEGSADDIPIRVCGVPDKKPYAAFALDVAEYTMKFYNRYFGIKYPYGKLDILGVADFSAGAMENTGCIISRDFIFVDPKGSSYQLRKIIAKELVAHEMAHQWFGDLVTMKWWDDVWLNEGFATWMSFKPVEAWKPEWNYETDGVRSATGAMGTDALSSTRAIQAHAETPGEIQELFDSLSYNKAAAVLWMVEGYVGEETFRKGVNSYLAKYSYANATSADFWNEIAQVSHKPVNRIMSGFIKQPGVPLVTLKTACSGGNTKVTLAQQRYFNDRSLLDAGSKEQWEIPVCLRSGKTEKCELLTLKEQQIELPGCTSGVYGNAGGRGYYRSSYDSENVRRLTASAERDLSPGERYMLIEDVVAQVVVNRLQAGDFMTLARDMSDDASTAVMDDLRDEMVFAGDYLVNDADRAEFQAWVRTTFEPVAERIGWTAAANESDETRARRGALLTLLGRVGRDPKVIQLARELVNKALKGESTDRTLLFAALPIAARDGDEALYNAIIGHFAQIRTPEEFLLWGQALCLFSDPSLLTRTLNFAVSPQMRAQDAPQVIGAVISNPAGRQLAWDFIRQHWTEVEAKLSNYSEGSIVSIGGVFCDKAKRDEFQEFFTEHKVAASERTFQLTLEQIDTCIDVRTHQEPNLQSWLEHQGASRAAAGGSR